MRQRRPASTALRAIADARPADRWTQMLARTPKRGLTPSACDAADLSFTSRPHAAGLQARARVAPRVVRLDRGDGHQPSRAPTSPEPGSSDSRLLVRTPPTTPRILGDVANARRQLRRALAYLLWPRTCAPAGCCTP